MRGENQIGVLHEVIAGWLPILLHCKFFFSLESPNTKGGKLFPGFLTDPIENMYRYPY